MFRSETVLVWSREEIFVDSRLQRFQDFCGCEVSLPGFGIGMINDDFSIAGMTNCDIG